MGQLLLYRGDAEEIDEFQFHKTNKHCLVGQGIYLTTKVEVADSYRSKGARDYSKFDFDAHRSYTYSVKGFGDRSGALKQFFLMFADCWRAREYGLRSKDWDVPFRRGDEERARLEYRDLIEEGQIQAKYEGSTTNRSIRVSLRRGYFGTTGHLSAFLFDSKVFEPSMFKVEGPIRDPFFWELMWDHGIPVGQPQKSKDFYIGINSQENHTIYSFRRDASAWVPYSVNMTSAQKHAYNVAQRGRRASSKLWVHVRKVIEPYGFRGFEYNGGRHLGGQGNHRAFCVWDEEFINQHRMEA